MLFCCHSFLLKRQVIFCQGKYVTWHTCRAEDIEKKKTIWIPDIYHTMFVALRLPPNVCHTMFVTQCLSHNVCHTVFVTQCFSHNVSHTLSHNVGYPTLDYSVCHRLFNTDCMTNMTNITKRSHLFSVFCSLSFCFNLLLLSFCLVFVLTALFRMHRACSIAGCFQNSKGKLAKISWVMAFKAKILLFSETASHAVCCNTHYLLIFTHI